MSNRVLRGAGGFKIGVTLDVLLTFTKLGDFRGHFNEVYGAQGYTRSQMWSIGAPMNFPDPEDSKLVSHLMHY